MNYVDALNQFNRFIEDLQTYYACEFAPSFDWDAIKNDLWFECLIEGSGGEWSFTEPDDALLESVLRAHDMEVS